MVTLPSHLLSEWHLSNPFSFHEIPFKSFRALWRCSLGHEWFARVDARCERNQGCPYCSNQKLLPGFNDVATKFPDLVKYWDNEKNVLSPSEVFPSRVVFWNCSKDHSYKSTAIRVKRSVNAGCPYCSGRLAIPGFNDLASKHPEIVIFYSKNNKISPSDLLPSSNKIVNWDCPNHVETYSMSVQKKMSGHGCPYCSTPIRKVLAGFNDLETKYSYLKSEWAECSREMSSFAPHSNVKVRWCCRKCKNFWKTAISNRTLNNSGCPLCLINKKFSQGEKELVNFIKDTFPFLRVIENSRSIISPKELDIFLPELNVAFEYNGDYWHSKEFLEKYGLDPEEIHKDKIDRCTEKGVTLFYVWENDWTNNNDEVKDSVMKVINDKKSRPYILSKVASDRDITFNSELKID